MLKHFPDAARVWKACATRWACGAAILGLLAPATVSAAERLRALILDGQSNHDFRGTTEAIRTTLASTGRFGDWSQVRVSRSPGRWEQAEPLKPAGDDPTLLAQYKKDRAAYAEARSAFQKQADLGKTFWRPPFDECDVVIVNYNGSEWPPHVADAFVMFVRDGGGAVIVHSATNPFEGWPAFNEMLGIGWRSQSFGRWIAIDDATGKPMAVPEATPAKSAHGVFAPFMVKTRDPAHPIMSGVPDEWLHAADELYFRMRGNPTNVHVLASAYSPDSRQHEPVVWWVPFGRGRVVTTTMGHYQRPEHYTALQCVGFQTVLARASEWAATGAVTIAVPGNFPSVDEPSVEVAKKVKWAR